MSWRSFTERAFGEGRASIATRKSSATGSWNREKRLIPPLTSRFYNLPQPIEDGSIRRHRFHEARSGSNHVCNERPSLEITAAFQCVTNAGSRHEAQHR